MTRNFLSTKEWARDFLYFTAGGLHAKRVCLFLRDCRFSAEKEDIVNCEMSLGLPFLLAFLLEAKNAFSWQKIILRIVFKK